MPCTFRCFSRHYFAQPSRMDCPGFTRLGIGPAPPWHRRRAVQRVGHSVLPPADKRLMRPRQPATRPAHLKHHKSRLPDRRPSLPWPPPRGRTRVQGIGSPAVTHDDARPRRPCNRLARWHFSCTTSSRSVQALPPLPVATLIPGHCGEPATSTDTSDPPCRGLSFTRARLSSPNFAPLKDLKSLSFDYCATMSLLLRSLLTSAAKTRLTADSRSRRRADGRLPQRTRTRGSGAPRHHPHHPHRPAPPPHSARTANRLPPRPRPHSARPRPPRSQPVRAPVPRSTSVL